MDTHQFLPAVALPIITALLTAVNTLTAADARTDQPSTTQGSPIYLNIQSKATQKLSDSLHGFDGNDLAELPKGEQVFGGVRFNVGDGYVRLSGSIETSDQPRKNEKVEGIPVGQSFSRLHILHGTGYGAFGKPGDALFIEDGTQIAEYLLHYEDGTTASIPVVYGQDVRDWWNWDKPAEVTRGKPAWTGTNAFSRREKQKINLYLTSWSNPHPEKKVLSIDYICDATGKASPFCIAISLER